MQLSLQDTISFKLLHSDKEGYLAKTLSHTGLNSPPKLVQELQRSYLRELVLILRTNRGKSSGPNSSNGMQGIGRKGKVHVLIPKWVRLLA